MWVAVCIAAVAVVAATTVVYDSIRQRKRGIDLAGKVVVITGGSSGIGLAAAKVSM